MKNEMIDRAGQAIPGELERLMKGEKADGKWWTMEDISEFSRRLRERYAYKTKPYPTAEEVVEIIDQISQDLACFWEPRLPPCHAGSQMV